MASPVADADAVRSAVSSIHSCNTATVVSLKTLLLPGLEGATSRSTKQTTATTGKAPRRTKTANDDNKNELSAKEKAALATYVLNASLKALADAAKPALKVTAKKECQDDPAKMVARRALRRSSSAPMTPLQPRSLNRVPTSPVQMARPRVASAQNNIATTCLPMVECARLALSVLRALQSGGKINLPELQLEAGMSSLVGRLINLGLHEHAIKELRLLKRRLEEAAGLAIKTPGNSTATETKGTAHALAELLDFTIIKSSESIMQLVVGTQIQVLRVMAAMKRPQLIEAALPVLRRAHHSSVINHILSLTKGPKADEGKLARQMETVSQTLLSLTASVSSKDDVIATDPRLSMSPVTSYELQALGMEARLLWWGLAGHKGDIDKEVMTPLARCIGAFMRRTADKQMAYQLCKTSSECIFQLLQSLSKQCTPASTSSKSPQSSIYQALASLARECGKLDDAIQWTRMLSRGFDEDAESAVKLCSVSAQLLAFQLKLDPAQYLQDETLLNQVVSGVQGSLRGETAELDDLLSAVCSLRRAVTGILLGQTGEVKMSPSARELLESFVLHCPRFCMRWLGQPPTPISSTRDYLRYDQRRQLLLQSIRNTLDSTFLLIRKLLEEKRLAWDTLENILADSLTLLDLVGTIPSNPLYHVKISNFYYMMYNLYRQQEGRETAALKALRRSIDCVKDRSVQEKDQAQLLVKLERMAELCRSAGRVDAALGAYQEIRSSLVADGVLKTIASTLQTRHPQVAWTVTAKADHLNRALSSIARLEMVHMDWTADFPELEQAAALEHHLHFVLLGGEKKSHELTMRHPTVDSLLRIYIPTRFPVRRLRTLLRLLSATVGNSELTADIQSVAADAVQLDEGALGEDVPLAPFLTHMKALFSSLTGLADGYSDPQPLEQALSAWRSLVDSNPTKEGLEGCIDGVEDLLLHLESIADLLRLKGLPHILDTVVHLSADISRIVEGPGPEYFLHTHKLLAGYLTDGGLSIQAAKTYEAVEAFIDKHGDASAHLMAELQLALADHFLLTGNSKEAIDRLNKASACFSASQSPPKISRFRKRMMFAQAAYLQGLIALQQGQFHHALMRCRESVRVLFQEWVRSGSQLPTDAEKTTVSEESKMDVSLSTLAKDNDTPVQPTGGPGFWILFRRLFRTILHLSSIYAQLGLFQETVYYAEMAETMARNAQSDWYATQAATWAASVYAKAGDKEKATELINRARSTLRPDCRSCSALSLICQMGSVYRALHNCEAEQEMMDMAESFLAALKPEPVTTELPEIKTLEKKMARLDVKEKTTVKVRTTRRTVRAAAVTTTARKTTRTAAPIKAKALTRQPTAAAMTEDPYLFTFRAAIFIHKAVSLLGKKDWARAAALLEDNAVLSTLPSGYICDNKKVVTAACLIGSSLEAMAHDSVFSVVQDSTLSFPTVAGAGSERSAMERLSLTQQSSPPTRKGRTTTAATRRDAAKETAQQSFVTSLLQAQKTLLEAHAEVALTGDGGLLHRVSAMLQTVTLVLSTVTTKGKTISQVAHCASSADLARNLTWRRERKAILQEKHTLKADGNGWPSAISSSPEDARRASLGFSTDLNKFQRDYVDILPKTWTTLSISLSENKHDLCITRLQAGHSPFVIRLPLERASSRDADTEVFNFQQGRAELLDIIRLANQTCHDARDMTVKANKAAWWADREHLDKRLRELLENIERDWLGGFRGIFSQHTRRADLLARFQKSFQNILDKHLPSRRQVRGRKGKAATTTTAASSSKFTLDPRILELFVGLGDPTAEEEEEEDCDFDDALTDLLYFVVDILQFHGERNAYDEIDFDAMVVDTLDALHAYHSTAKTETSVSSKTHTILVLDKALHTFPWESLPCMRGQAVSRVPSLACLRRLILEQQPASSNVSDAPAGHHIPSTAGTYVLNPSRDLQSTQTTFSKPLSTHLPTWTPILAREPTESEFVTALTLPSSVLLYFGHGSGAQYIRGKAIRRLDPGVKAVSLLWGCSSAKLEDCGEFECHGTVWNYLMAGCPAVTGTLWDVTDRDIDRFAARTLEGWGLLPGGSVKVEDGRKGKGVVRARKDEKRSGREGRLSLVEAVAAAREGACRFRYLTAASVVVYGIPVYVDRKE